MKETFRCANPQDNKIDFVFILLFELLKHPSSDTIMTQWKLVLVNSTLGAALEISAAPFQLHNSSA